MYSMPTGATRELLIDATRKLLWQRGYAATSPRVILEDAGVGQGSLYHHFRGGKEQLAAEALAVTARELLGGAQEVLRGPGSAVHRLTGYLLRQRDALRGCPIGRMTGDADVLASPALHDIVGTTFESVRQLMCEVIDQGIEAGELPDALDSGNLADTVLAVVQGGYVLARAAGTPEPFDRAVRGAVTLVESAARNPSTGSTSDKKERK